MEKGEFLWMSLLLATALLFFEEMLSIRNLNVAR